MFDEETSRIRKQQKFLADVEQSIAEVNRRVIHARIDRLDRASFVALAGRVAELRASYLEAALAAVGSAGSEAFVALRQQRKVFEEAMAAFAALERAIERGYVDIDDAS
jgi:hypothetical protein